MTPHSVLASDVLSNFVEIQRENEATTRPASECDTHQRVCDDMNRAAEAVAAGQLNHAIKLYKAALERSQGIATAG